MPASLAPERATRYSGLVSAPAPEVRAPLHSGPFVVLFVESDADADDLERIGAGSRLRLELRWTGDRYVVDVANRLPFFDATHTEQAETWPETALLIHMLRTTFHGRVVRYGADNEPDSQAVAVDDDYLRGVWDAWDALQPVEPVHPHP